VTQGMDPYPESSRPAPPPPRDYGQGDDPQEPPKYGLDPTDTELLRAHVAGDPHAFATLVARHQDRLWAVALGVMRNPDDAADALQEAYISAFRRADSFRGDAKVTTWLHRVVVNACLDRLRSLKVRATESLPDDPDRSAELGVEEPVDPVEAQQQRDQILDALGRLNPDQRAALVLVDMQGYSVDEAATILGCAPGTVKSRCARGRARLALLLVGLREPIDNGGDPLEPPPRAQEHTGAREHEEKR
jgi:RNA polymerase sigma-70 factor, ECF subfamily